MNEDKLYNEKDTLINRTIGLFLVGFGIYLLYGLFKKRNE